jgi:hypothetical protein
MKISARVTTLEAVHGTEQQRLSPVEIDAAVAKFACGYQRLANDPDALERLGEINADTYRAAVEGSRVPWQQRVLASMDPVDILL